MYFTNEERKRLSHRTRYRVAIAIKRIVDWSYTVRPMVDRTESEDSRREKICLDYWRRQTSQGRDVSVAAQNLPTLLVAAIDNEEDSGKVKSIVEPGEFASGMFPSARDQVNIIEPERSLTALSNLKGK